MDPSGAVREAEDEGKRLQSPQCGLDGGHLSAWPVGQHVRDAGGTDGQIRDGNLKQDLLQTLSAGDAEELIEEHIARTEEHHPLDALFQIVEGTIGGQASGLHRLLQFLGDVGEAPLATAEQAVQELKHARVATNDVQHTIEPGRVSFTQPVQTSQQLAALGAAQRAYRDTAQMRLYARHGVAAGQEQATAASTLKQITQVLGDGGVAEGGAVFR